MKSPLFWCLVALLTLCQPSMGIGSQVPTVGDRLIPITLEIPADAGYRAYLGLEKASQPGIAEASFGATAIKGRLLIIEIFSMYCPHCQREAPVVNRLYQGIEASRKLRGQVKLIGIGVGNSAFEVSHFRKHYQIEFPLFPDEDFIIHKELGELRTPFFIIVGLDPGNRGRILWTGAGKVDPPETFLNRLERFLEHR